jgi:hypothetical protein
LEDIMKDKKVDAADPGSDQPDSESTQARRRFLGKVGKVAVTTSAVTLMLSAGGKRGVAGNPYCFNEWH